MTIGSHPEVVFRDWQTLHPAVRMLFRNLEAELGTSYEKGATHTWFRMFESYRSPERQAMLRTRGTTKADPWQSAHQYGLAADFVAYIPDEDPKKPGKWSWDDNHDYKFLGSMAANYGLLQPLPGWDPHHIESPLWRHVKDALAR